MENSPQSSNNNPMAQGCGPNTTQINVRVSPTTGGDFFISVDSDSSVENLKKMVSKRLKVPRDRICLLFRDKQLQDGSLLQHGISEGSRVTLLPNVETGLINQRPEVGIMQALESLNDTQVNEFLCGKAPLNLSMRLGDHMMLIQLQLSTVSSTNKPTNCAPLVQTQAPPSLLQASKNLQHTLKRLSADIFAGRERGRVRGRKESVYSGTFSGALSPTLQDSRGRPRRDVATIVHILNDLLCSVPEVRRMNGDQVVPESDESSPTSEDVSLNTPSTSSTALSLENNTTILASSSSSSTELVGADQNSVTRSKLDHLRLVMGERRERRRQRKQKPYSLPTSEAAADTVSA